MINAGAIVCTSLIDSDLQLSERFENVMHYWEMLSGGKRPGYNNSVYHSELETADRNYAIAHFLRENGALEKDASIKKTLEFYYVQ